MSTGTGFFGSFPMLTGSISGRRRAETKESRLTVRSGDQNGDRSKWKDLTYEVFEPIEAVALTPEEWEKGQSAIVECAKGGEIIYGRERQAGSE